MNATIEFPTLNYGDTLCVSILSVYIYIYATRQTFSIRFRWKKTRKYFRKVELPSNKYEKYGNDLKLSSTLLNKITIFLFFFFSKNSLLKLTFKRDQKYSPQPNNVRCDGLIAGNSRTALEKKKKKEIVHSTLTTLSTPGTPVRPPVMTIKWPRCSEILVVNQYELENNLAIIHRSAGNPHERPAALPVRN